MSDDDDAPMAEMSDRELQTATPDHVFKHWRSIDGIAVVASLAGERAGGIVVTVSQAEALIAHLVVDRRFQRRGLGLRLIAQALTLAQARGEVKGLSVITREENVGAKALYGRLGLRPFKPLRYPDGTEGIIMRCEGVVADALSTARGVIDSLDEQTQWIASTTGRRAEKA
jgi:ribosomal protein S18 acetylase RimI-like enzyme